MGSLVITKSTPSTETVYVAPCLKCGGENIHIGDCGYSSFNVAYGKCQNPQCKHEVKFNCGWDVEQKAIVEVWNKANDIDLLIEQKLNSIATLKEEMKELQKLKKARSSKRKSANGG